jgi:hypothetical protein
VAKPGKLPPIEAAVEVLSQRVSQASKSRNFRILIVADTSGVRHEITLQRPKQKWE